MAAAEKHFTYSDVAEHTTKKDIHIVVHDEVFNASSFVDEHPGGEEVLMDVAGQDATEAFEDVGHSDEAREILRGLLVGKLKRQPGDPVPKAAPPPVAGKSPSSDGGSGGMGAGLYVLILMGGVLAFGAYQYLQTQKDK